MDDQGISTQLDCSWCEGVRPDFFVAPQAEALGSLEGVRRIRVSKVINRY